MGGSGRNGLGAGHDLAPSDGLVTKTVYADRAVDVAARPEDVSVGEKQNGVSCMGGYVCGIGCCLHELIGRSQLTIPILPAMGAAFDEQITRGRDVIVCAIANRSHSDVVGNELPCFARKPSKRAIIGYGQNPAVAGGKSRDPLHHNRMLIHIFCE